MAIKISGTTVINDSRNIENIGIATATTFSGQVNAGVGTITTLTSTNANVTGVGTITTLTSTNANVTGVGTITTLNGTNLNYTGVGTFSTLKVGTGVTISAGIITATSSITIGSTDVLTASTGKAIAMAIVFG